MLCDEQKAPNPSGHYLYLQFNPSHVYCLIPSNNMSQAAMLYYPEIPEYLLLFKYYLFITEVSHPFHVIAH